MSVPAAPDNCSRIMQQRHVSCTLLTMDSRSRRDQWAIRRSAARCKKRVATCVSQAVASKWRFGFPTAGETPSATAFPANRDLFRGLLAPGGGSTRDTTTTTKRSQDDSPQFATRANTWSTATSFTTLSYAPEPGRVERPQRPASAAHTPPNETPVCGHFHHSCSIPSGRLTTTQTGSPCPPSVHQNSHTANDQDEHRPPKPPNIRLPAANPLCHRSERLPSICRPRASKAE